MEDKRKQDERPEARCVGLLFKRVVLSLFAVRLSSFVVPELPTTFRCRSGRRSIFGLSLLVLSDDVQAISLPIIIPMQKKSPDRILSEECGRGLRFKCCGSGCLHPLADGDGGDEDVDFADATLLQEIGERKERRARRHQIIDEEDTLAL